MTEQEKAEFVLAMITNEGITIPASLARQLVECQEWLTKLSEVKLKNVAKN